MARVEAPGPVTPDQGKFLDARHDPTHPLVRGRTRMDQDSSKSVFPDNGRSNPDLTDLDLLDLELLTSAED